jgi:hypothetical protein
MRIKYPIALATGFMMFLISALLMSFVDYPLLNRDIIACASFILMGFSVEFKDSK